jgi:hypothetical protein
VSLRSLRKLHRALYRVLRAAGDVQAVQRGPRAVGRRLGRRQAHRVVNRLLRKL